MSHTHSRYQTARKWLIFWCLFIGLGAVGGAVGMLVKPDGSAMGMQTLLPYFQVLPFADALFHNFVFPGIALLCVNGIPNLIAAGLLLGNRKSGVVAGGVFGVTLMLWICIQFVIFPLNFMSTIYFVFGLCQAATGYAGWVFRAQEQFRADAAAYPGIGSNPRRLVVFFSRMGYVRKIAYEVANQCGAELYEVKATENTQGTLGFWWCGRYGMHRWDMPIQGVDVDWDRYDHVDICAPIWVFALAAPMRSFCKAARGKIREADYYLIHFRKGTYANAAQEMDGLLGIERRAAYTVCCKRGRYGDRVKI